MRVLVGYTNSIPEIFVGQPLPGREDRGDEIVAFGAEYARQVAPGMPWAEICAGLPDGWTPDVYIHWSPEYNAMPDGLERADCLTVGVWGDWNLGGQAIHCVAGAFDLLFADAPGAQRLQSLDYNALPAQLWAQNPRLHRVLSDEEKAPERDIDILMIGNFNHAVQSERARWLARVARLSEKYNVMLTSGLYGDAYVETMNRAKIVFNRSIRGEVNMRAYEAPACGALLFYERGNLEIGNVLVDGDHCVLYDDSDLEAQFAYWLAPENAGRREQVAQAGWERVQAHTYAHHFAGMLDAIETSLPERRTKRPPLDRLALAKHWLLSVDRNVLPRIGRDAEAALADQTALAANRLSGPARRSQALWLTLAGTLKGEWALCLPVGTTERQAYLRDAVGLTEQALRLEPDYVLARINLATLLQAGGRADASVAALRSVYAALGNADLPAWTLQGVRFPRRYDALDAASELLWTAHIPGSDDWRDAMQTLLRGHTALQLAQTEWTSDRFEQAASYAGIAVRDLPDHSDAHLTHARVLAALGRLADAEAAYRTSLTLCPFAIAAWEERAQLLLDSEQPVQAVALLDEWLTILHGTPVYRDHRTHAERLYRLAAQAVPRQAAQHVEIPNVTRLLALPDWRSADDWQTVLRWFVMHAATGAPVTLLLRVDPQNGVRSETVFREVEAFLMGELGCDPDRLPDITLLPQPIAPRDRWKLLHAANRIVTARPLLSPWETLAHNLNIPIEFVSIESLKTDEPMKTEPTNTLPTLPCIGETTLAMKSRTLAAA